MLVLLFLACAKNKQPVDTSSEVGSDFLAIEADCPSGGRVGLEVLGEPLSVVLCDADTTECAPVAYGLTHSALTVQCGDGGLVRVVWGME